METDLKGFDEFWLAYPRRVAKEAAKRMYRRALKLTTAEQILRAAKCYAAERAGKEVEFTAHPATWLNAGRWADYQISWQATAPKANGTMVYVAFNDPALDEWEAYGRRKNGRGYPRDRAGGWWFPSQHPPTQSNPVEHLGHVD